MVFAGRQGLSASEDFPLIMVKTLSLVNLWHKNRHGSLDYEAPRLLLCNLSYGMTLLVHGKTVYQIPVQAPLPMLC